MDFARGASAANSKLEPDLAVRLREQSTLNEVLNEVHCGQASYVRLRKVPLLQSGACLF